MIELEINGKAVAVEDGATVMEAAERLGIFIPHFCYHKKLSIAANCRMCLVEVEKAPKPLPACATPATNGMKVWTHSPKAVQAQKGVMEFLLINHPLDCPICDQGGECQLQDLAVGYGQCQHRFAEEKRVVPNKYLGPLIETFMTRCINCTRCVRFLAEIGGYQELGQAFRGEHAEILPFLEKTVDSEISGNIIDLCPVGALTSKPFLYRARTWELSRRRSISPHDAWGSNLIVQTKFDEVRRVLPLENEAINECWLSDRDRFAYEGLNARDRLTQPLVKRGHDWVAVDWKTALEVAVNRLKSVADENGAQAIALLAHPMSTVEELYLLRRLAEALGGAVTDTRVRQSDERADAARGGVAWLGSDIASIATADAHWFLGARPRQELPLMAVRLRAAAQRGAAILDWGTYADDWKMPLAAQRTTSAQELLVVMASLALANAAAGGPAVPDWAQSLARPLSREESELLARFRAGAQRRVWLGRDLLAHPNAAEFEVLAHHLATSTGATLGWLVDGANAVGAALVGANGARTAQQRVSEPHTAYLWLHLEPEDFLDPQAAQAALAQARSVVALTAYASPALLAHADVLLPVAPFTETSGTFVNIAGDAQSFPAVVRPRGETRPAWKVLAAIGAMLGQPLDYVSSDAVRDAALPVGYRSRLAAAGSRDLATVRLDAVVSAVRDLGMYQGDAIVRRARALQQTSQGRREQPQASQRNMGAEVAA